MAHGFLRGEAALHGALARAARGLTGALWGWCEAVTGYVVSDGRKRIMCFLSSLDFAFLWRFRLYIPMCVIGGCRVSPSPRRSWAAAPMDRKKGISVTRPALLTQQASPKNGTERRKEL